MLSFCIFSSQQKLACSGQSVSWKIVKSKIIHLYYNVRWGPAVVFSLENTELMAVTSLRKQNSQTNESTSANFQVAETLVYSLISWPLDAEDLI